MDVHSKEVRSYNMSQIRGTKTKPEDLVAKYLFSQGFRYRRNVKSLPGSPDIVLKNIEQLSLSTDVFGMLMRDVKGFFCLTLTENSGRQNFSETENAIAKIINCLQISVGKYLLFGNVI